MNVRVIAASPHDPREDRVAAAVEVLREGGIVALPTETFYGLAADATQPRAVARLNTLKRKPAESPSLLLLADPAQTERVARDLPPAFHALAERFWPGPLTLILRARDDLAPEVHGGRATVGVRVPGIALPRRIAATLGAPITGVSANVSGEPPARTAAEVAAAFGDPPGGVDLILDGGPAPGGAPSTLVDLSGDGCVILRHGAVPAAALEAFF